MSKNRSFSVVLSTIKTYTSNTTVHGLSYITDPALPRLDRVVWLILVGVFAVFAVVISHGVFQQWQENKVTTTLKDTEFPVTKLEFPAITLCSTGMTMDRVEQVMEQEYQVWAKNKRDKRATGGSVGVEVFLSDVFGIDDDESILDIITGLVATDANNSFVSNGIRKPCHVTSEHSKY